MTERIGEKRLPEREGVIFVIYNKGKYLLEERLNPESTYFGYVIVPGGSVENDKDQDSLQAAMREIFEECGIVPRKVTVLDTFLHTIISGKLLKSTAVLVTDYDGEITNMEGKSNHIQVDYDTALELMPFAESRYCLMLAKQALIAEGQYKG